MPIATNASTRPAARPRPGELDRSGNPHTDRGRRPMRSAIARKPCAFSGGGIGGTAALGGTIGSAVSDMGEVSGASVVLVAAGGSAINANVRSTAEALEHGSRIPPSDRRQRVSWPDSMLRWAPERQRRALQIRYRAIRRSGDASVVVEALLDQLLLDRSTARVEAGELEVLLELEVDVVEAAAVLLDRHHDPVAEALRLVRVELDVDLGDDVVLVVQDQDDVGLVVDGRQPRRWKLRRRDARRPSLSAATIAIIGTSSDRAMSLRPFTTKVTFSDSVSGSGCIGTFCR